MSVESSDDLEAAGKNSDMAIITANKEIIRSGANATEISTLASLAID